MLPRFWDILKNIGEEGREELMNIDPYNKFDKHCPIHLCWKHLSEDRKLLKDIKRDISLKNLQTGYI